MIRLLLGITLSETGGSQRVVYDLLAGLPEEVYEITLLTSPGGELIDWVKTLNQKRKNPVKIVTWTCLKRSLSPVHDLNAFLKMLVWLVKNRFDIAHFHNSKMGIIGRIPAKIARVPSVFYTVHGWGLNPATTNRMYGVLSFLERIAARFASKIIFVSRADLEKGVRNRWASRERCCLIYNGTAESPLKPAHIREQLNISRQLPVIAFVARLAEPKDPLFAIKVSSLLQKSGVRHKLLIIGDGPGYDACAELIHSLDCGGCVTMLGKRDDVPAILNESDIFCLFSKWEGLPVSILEAMQSGLPVVASAVGGVPELVIDGQTGFLLHQNDENEAARLLTELLNDPAKRRQMGTLGRIYAKEKFSLGDMLNGYRRLYEQKQEKAEKSGGNNDAKKCSEIQRGVAGRRSH